MDIQKLITICFVCTIIDVNFVVSLPTFGNEYVHIKVHIPHETSSTKDILKPEDPVTHHETIHHVRHKVIHHHHHHRKPVKKLSVKETAPLLENFYLAELDKPYHNYDHSYQHNHRPKHVEETYLVTQEHHHSNPIEKIKTIKVIEEYGHHPEFQTKDLHQHDQGDHDHHFETVKFVEEQPQYNYQEENNYHVPRKEVLKVVQTPKYTPSVIEEEYNYHIPQKNIVERKPTVPKECYKNYDPEDQLLYGIIEESLEIIKTKRAKNHNYHTYYGSQSPKEYGITKSQEEYHKYQAAPETSHHYNHEPEVSIEQHIQYENPTTGQHLAPHQHYTPPKPEYEKPSSSHNFAKYHHYDASKPNSPENIQHYSTHSAKYESPTSGHHYALNHHYGPPKSDSSENLQHYPQHSATYRGDSYENKQKFAADYRQYLPSSETPKDFNELLNPKDDFSNTVENPHAPETYIGYDSYSAGHVQGLGSGSYRHHTP